MDKCENCQYQLYRDLHGVNVQIIADECKRNYERLVMLYEAIADKKVVFVDDDDVVKIVKLHEDLKESRNLWRCVSLGGWIYIAIHLWSLG